MKADFEGAQYSFMLLTVFCCFHGNVSFSFFCRFWFLVSLCCSVWPKVFFCLSRVEVEPLKQLFALALRSLTSTSL